MKIRDLTFSGKEVAEFLIFSSGIEGLIAAEGAFRMEQVKKEDYGSIRFGWAGAMEAGKQHYYRIQGKTFLVEFDNTGKNANHIHTVWRDFEGDFGEDLIRAHYKMYQH